MTTKNNNNNLKNCVYLEGIIIVHKASKYVKIKMIDKNI